MESTGVCRVCGTGGVSVNEEGTCAGCAPSQTSQDAPGSDKPEEGDMSSAQ